MLHTGDILDGKYEIQREVGRGGMSIVYLAMDKRLNKLWAVKEIKDSGKDSNGDIFVTQFLTEANMLMRLDHPALPRIVDLINDNGKRYVVMDFVEGQNLFEVLKERGAFPEDEVIEWAKQITDALAYLHRQNPPIIYRDMKPGNVMLKPDGNIKIIDFGIAREYKMGNLTDTVALGTRGYIPPEQYSGQTDPRSDIYAVGMTMHHLVTGVDPRTADAYAPVRNWNPNLSEGIELIINKCTAPAPENRYQNCDELLYDLAHPDQITKEYRKKQKSKLRTFSIFALCAALCLGGGAGVQIAANAMDKANYAQIVADIQNTTTPMDERFELAREAMKLNNNDPVVLESLIQFFWNGPDFTSTYATEFQEVYSMAAFKEIPRTEAEFDLNLSIAQMYMLNYVSDTAGGASETRTRMDGAMAFLQKNNAAIQSGQANAYKQKQISVDYFTIIECFSAYLGMDSNSGSANPHSEESGASGKQAKVDQFFEVCDAVVTGHSTSGEGDVSQETLTSRESVLLYSTIMKVFDQMKATGDSEANLQRARDLAEKMNDQLSVETIQDANNPGEETGKALYMGQPVTDTIGDIYYRLVVEFKLNYSKLMGSSASYGSNEGGHGA